MIGINDVFPSSGSGTPPPRVHVKFPKPGSYTVIGIDSTQELKMDMPTIAKLKAAIGAAVLDMVQLRNPGPLGLMMAVDDEGMSKALRPNPIGTTLYHMNCRKTGKPLPPICGNVVLFWDSDFEE